MICVKKDDTRPLDVTLRRGGSAIDLTGATVRFIMTNGVKTVEGNCTLEDAAAGEVRFSWAPGDLDTAAIFRAEWEITYTGGEIETVPGSGYENVKVVEDLD